MYFTLIFPRKFICGCDKNGRLNFNDSYTFNSFSSFVTTVYYFPILNIMFFYSNSYPINKINSAMKTCRQNGRQTGNPKDRK